MDLKGKKVVVLAGDRRMLEIARLARQCGAEVRAFGTAKGAEEVGASEEATLDKTLQDADLVICPLPGVGPDDSLWAPHSLTPIFLTERALAHCAQGCVLVCGRLTPGLRATVERAGLSALSQAGDEEEALYHAIPTAEGAVRHAIEMSDVTLMGSKSLCIGYGRVGQSVSWLLRGMGASVTVCARNPSQRARAAGFGLRARPLDALATEIQNADFVFQTVPGDGQNYILNTEVLDSARRDAVIIDLSSPPAATDFDYCSQLKLRSLWARGQAGSSPKTAGENEWNVILRLYREHLEPGD